MVNLLWTREKPTEPGWYLYKPSSQWAWHIVKVDLGRWQLAQDPSKLYMGARDLVENAEYGWWCGPLEEPKGV